MNNNYKGALDIIKKALEVNPNYFRAWYNQACYFALLNNADSAIKSLQEAIRLEANQCRKEAKDDEDFDLIRKNEEFQKEVYGSIRFS